MQLKLLTNVSPVVLHSANAHEQLIGDFTACLILGDEGQDTPLQPE